LWVHLRPDSLRKYFIMKLEMENQKEETDKDQWGLKDDFEDKVTVYKFILY
jgi:hypothetical protein